MSDMLSQIDCSGDRILPIECELQKSGYQIVVGTDEAGRGPLAGPVVAAAVIFENKPQMWKCRDSKTLLPARREELYLEVFECFTCAVGICTHDEIDSLNILRASLLAMSRAVSNLPEPANIVLVDGNQKLPLSIPSKAIVKGDARVATISAASIIAKVTRDRIMREYELEYPGYGLARNFGYPTAEHRSALKRLGPSPIHRKSFHGVRELVE